jgi:hexosaminidase
VRLGRLPYYFQLAHDEPARRFEPAQSPHGELLLRTGGCEGEPVASLPLPEAPGADGFIELDLPLPDAGADAGRTDLCLIATGDTRPTMWVLDRMELVPR